EYWLASTIDNTKELDSQDNLIFINAWNEWAEGCHLEPDRRYGNAFLQATINAKNGVRRFTTFPDVALPAMPDKPVKSIETAMAAPKSFWQEASQITKYHIKLTINKRPWLRRLLLPIVRLMR
ncbi:MAG: glycoside hydrolase family 99-like domain-containing protein, partial [Burkholderiaceae bacterium]